MNDLKHGYGVYISKNRKILDGMWVQGKFQYHPQIESQKNYHTEVSL